MMCWKEGLGLDCLKKNHGNVVMMDQTSIFFSFKMFSLFNYKCSARYIQELLLS